MVTKQFLVVAYDISNDRRRRKVAKTLEKYGLRCNESVFECLLTEAQIRQMQKCLLRQVDEHEDSLLYYYLCKPCVLKRESVGFKPKFGPELILI